MNFVWALALLIVSYAITAFTAKKTTAKDAQPSTLADFTFPQHEEGTPQCVIFGDVWTSDWMVLFTGDLQTQAIRTKTKSGKKK